MDLIKQIQAAGIVGCGGAGFPTHVKYSGVSIETIIINGAECEPLLRTDRYLMRHFASEIVSAAGILQRETGAAACVIVLKRSYRAEKEALQSAIRAQNSTVRLHTLDSFFPAGDEQTLVYEVTGRVVPPAGIPIRVGCVVSNIATILCIHQALADLPFTQKYLTVTGEVHEPVIVKAPIGTPVRDCIELAGGPAVSDYVVINGGPMMGKLMTREQAENAFVTKTMSGLVVLPSDNAIAQRQQTRIEHMLNRAHSACIQCSFCSQLCPRALLGHPLQPHRIMRKLAVCRELPELIHDPDIQNAALCCECGVCEIYACPMGLQPRRVNVLLKGELAKAGIRYQCPDGEWQAHPDRILRKIPTVRAAARAGVSAYNNIQIDTLREAAPGMVTIALRQNIGAMSEPVVNNGDWVECGQLIAVCPEGELGANLHASICGTVTIQKESITITAGERRL